MAEIIRENGEEEGDVWQQYNESPLERGFLFEGFLDSDDNASQVTEVISQEQHQQQQTEHRILGVPVSFPGSPYPSQVRIMEQIIGSLENGGNCLIESPTGSGKTLALLCAALGWRQYRMLQHPDKPIKKIFYCTKTHAQVSTVIKELQKTVYAQVVAVPQLLPEACLKVTVLGSRSQMCVNPAASAEGTGKVDDFCETHLKNFKKNKKNPSSKPLPVCPFYKDEADDFFCGLQEGHSVVRDIEDMKVTARENQCCAFYGARRQQRFADLVICPYNYIISSSIRRAVQIDLQESIIIFDEGHNLEKALCAEGSMSLSNERFGEIAANCFDLGQDKSVTSPVRIASEKLSDIFTKVRSWMAQEQTPQNQDKFSGQAVLDELRAKELGPDNLSTLRSYLDWITGNGNDPQTGPTLDKTTENRIKKVISVLEYLYKSESTERDYYLKVENGQRGSQKINIMCLNPGLVFREISEKSTSIAITSGTLTPLDTYAQELGIPFRPPLSLDQSIPRDRYMVARLAVGPEARLPPLTYQDRSNKNVQQNLGEAILQICEKVPHGVIVFFPSKKFIQNLMTEWDLSLTQDGRLWSRIKKAKHVVNELEMTTPDKTRKLLQEYRDKSKEGNGALLIGVHRGKVSEGVDFADEQARAVINVGIPLAPIWSAEVVARKHYFRMDSEGFNKWYTTDAMRAVNQGLGRAVRHRNDWGAIIMMDPRFLDRDTKEYLPAWIANASDGEYKEDGAFVNMIQDLEEFVMRMQAVQ